MFSIGLGTAQTDHCAELTGYHIPGVAMEITKAAWIAANGQAMPAYCRVDGTINRRTGVNGMEFGIGFALALPENWNHDFLMQGGGGLNGSVQPPLGASAAGNTPGLARGFAVVSTDTGHKGKGGFDPAFLADQQAMLDFAYQAIGRVAETARQIIAHHYGSPAAHSYYVGCSTGGREGMIMTQRYPTYFDGVVSGAPAMRTGFSNLADRSVAVAFNQIAPKDAAGKPIPGGALSESDRKLVIDALLKRCDAQDGLRDGMIFNITACDFDPTALVCSGAKNDTCLTSEQAGAIKRGFSGPKDSQGFQVYPGFLFDTGINAKAGIPGLLNPGVSPVGPREPPVQQDVDREALPHRTLSRIRSARASARSPATAANCSFITAPAIPGSPPSIRWTITRSWARPTAVRKAWQAGAVCFLCLEWDTAAEAKQRLTALTCSQPSSIGWRKARPRIPSSQPERRFLAGVARCAPIRGTRNTKGKAIRKTP